MRVTNMVKHFNLFLLFSTLMINGFAAKKKFPDIFPGGEKKSQLQLYVQDMLQAPTPTPLRVAMANSSGTSPTFFGLIAVLDDPVRMRPSPDAEIVGRAQGLFSYTSLEEISIYMTFDLIFTGGLYNGSTLNLLGRNPYPRAYRQLSVVGGTGAFLLARGHVGMNTESTDKGESFFHYNITVLHY